MVDLAQMRRWAVPAKPSQKAQSPQDEEGSVEKGEEVWNGLSSEDVEALGDEKLDQFDEWLAEHYPSVRETVIELAGAIAEPNTKLRRHAEKELSGQVAEESGEEPTGGLSESQVAVLIEQLEMAVEDEGFEAGSDELRRAAIRAVAACRSVDAGEEAEEPAVKEKRK